jgi:hypothetical protein
VVLNEALYQDVINEAHINMIEKTPCKIKSYTA